jgi:hypothetical protein
MKRLLPLLVGLSLVSCDSGTKHTEGTSSETQTALQALADNVREIPREPGGGAIPAASPVAGRLAVEGSAYTDCYSSWRWTQDGWFQWEFYDGHDWTKFSPDPHPDLLWMVSRNELATDPQGYPLVGTCPTGPMRARASNRWRSRNGELASFEGLFERARDSGGMTSSKWVGSIVYPSGFQLGATFTASGPNKLLEPDTLQEWSYSFGEGRYGFRFRFSLGQDGTSWQSWESENDSIYCAPILDRSNGGSEIGSVCGTRRLSRWTIRDANGFVVTPRGGALEAPDDSMGVRFLSTRWEGDSLRIRLRVRTAPFSLAQWSRTSIVVGDTLTESSYAAIKPKPGDMEFVLPDTNFVGPETVELAFAAEDLANRSTMRVDLNRAYWRPTERPWTIGTWSFRIPPRED